MRQVLYILFPRELCLLCPYKEQLLLVFLPPPLSCPLLSENSQCQKCFCIMFRTLYVESKTTTVFTLYSARIRFYVVIFKLWIS